MAPFVAKYDSSHLGERRLAPCAYTVSSILPYISKVFHLEGNGGEGYAEELTEEKRRIVYQEECRDFRNLLLCNGNRHVGYVCNTLFVRSNCCQTLCNMIFCNICMRLMCIETI
jgi:hypothetical protein